MSDPLDDPTIRRHVDRAVAPYAGRLTPEELEQLRNFLATQLAAHPTLSRKVARVRERAPADHSGTVDKEGAPVEKLAEKARAKGGGGKRDG